MELILLKMYYNFIVIYLVLLLFVDFFLLFSFFNVLNVNFFSYRYFKGIIIIIGCRVEVGKFCCMLRIVNGLCFFLNEVYYNDNDIR